jgi:hypothetical protein
VRVTADTDALGVRPGREAQFTVEVVNTSDIIDGVTAQVIGLAADQVSVHPAVLPLFPDSSGQLTLTVRVPRSFAAGRHPISVEVFSHAAVGGSELVNLDLVVDPEPQIEVRARPQIVRAHRKATFVLAAVNDGNVPLRVDFGAKDADRTLATEFAPDVLVVPPGSSRDAVLTVRGPRMLTGNVLDRALTVEAVARGLPEPLTGEAVVTLRQRPRFSKGMMVACALVGIVGLWALAFLLGLRQVFASDPFTKEAPASFFAAASAPPPSASSVAGGGAGGGGPALQPAAAAAPAGALSKDQPLPPGVGGVLTGQVTAASDGEPVGRILVEALRQSRAGLVVVSSAATQADGSYSIAGLFPGQYFLRYSATGFTTSWYPAATSQSSAKSVTANAGVPTGSLNAVVTGLPASITGKIDPGDTLAMPSTTVSARPLAGSNSAKPAATATTDGSGAYKLTGLPAPGSYELSFATEGYQTTTIVETVNGGQQRLEPTVQLSSGPGQISGLVTDGVKPLGGVTVTTTVDGKSISTGTPTVGQVGRYVITGLATPATYVLTFSHDGFADQSVVVDLAAGAQRADVDVSMVGGTGSVSGRLVDSDGAPLGGATVTVGGAPTAISTTTLTNGDVGSFVVTGLMAPGSYTLTFTLDGYQSQTVPVVLSADSPPLPIQVKTTKSDGEVSGVVRDASGAGVVGASITVTNGAKTWTTTSSGSSGSTPAGHYLVSGLPPGAYTVIAAPPAAGEPSSAPSAGTDPAAVAGAQAALVRVAAGETSAQDFTVADSDGGG